MIGIVVIAVLVLVVIFVLVLDGFAGSITSDLSQIHKDMSLLKNEVVLLAQLNAFEALSAGDTILVSFPEKQEPVEVSVTIDAFGNEPGLGWGFWCTDGQGFLNKDSLGRNWKIIERLK